jgi:hypothetical protein
MDFIALRSWPVYTSTGDLEGKAPPKTYGNLLYVYLNYQISSNNIHFYSRRYTLLEKNKLSGGGE